MAKTILIVDDSASLRAVVKLAKVSFGQVNLCQPIPDIGPFDVIFLRNVLIYFDAATKQQVVDGVLARLRPGGLFFIGTAEGRVPCKTKLEALAARRLHEPRHEPARRCSKRRAAHTAPGRRGLRQCGRAV